MAFPRQTGRMPEHESAPAVPRGGLAGGYPPMAPLRGAVPGWPSDTSLTTAATAEDARRVLQAEAATSVLHASGLRWGVVRGVALGVVLVVWLWAAVTTVGRLIGGDVARLPGGLVLVGFVALVVTRLVPWGWLRVDPSRESLPSTRRERLQLRAAAFRGAMTTAPAAAWPPGSEPYALLASAAKANEIDPAWLLGRAGLPAGVGAQWLDVMGRCGWLTGGDASFGRWLRQPVTITADGRQRLEEERTRLLALAGG